MALNYLVSKVGGIPEGQLANATNGAEAYDKTLKMHFDIILMDLNMPIMDGFETSEKIRSFNDMESRPQPVIIMLSAHVDN